MGDDKILNTLEEAENTVAMLRKMIEAQQEGKVLKDATHPPSIASDPNMYAKNMTISTVKLFETNGQEVFRIADSVGLYFIVPSNNVRTAARSALLRIVRLTEDVALAAHPSAFIQVGDWVYPLMPGSLVYRSQHKYYLFPDLLSDTVGTSVGVVLPKSCTLEERQRFEKLLLDFVGLADFPIQPSEFGNSTDLILSARTSVDLIRTMSGAVYANKNVGANANRGQVQDDQGYGNRIGAGFKAGGQLLSRGFELGAVGTANAISLGATCLKSAIEKEEQARDIPAPVVGTIVCAKDVTGKVVNISSSILSALTTVTCNIATLTACYIKASAAPILVKIIDSTGIGQDTIDTIDEITSEVQKVGRGIVDGGLEAYAGLEHAAKILANSLNSNTVEIIAHCYGPAAAGIIQSAGEVVGNVAMTGINTGQVTRPKRILCRSAKKAGLTLAFQGCSSQS